MSDDETTIGRRPLPHRPKNGLLAWEATMGYISAHHSPDAMLKLQIYPYQDGVRWAASASWSQNEETVGDKDSVAAALRDLWRVLSMHHTIFKSTEAASRRPIDYDEWLDTSTTTSIGRLIDVARAVYDDDWLIIIIYQPVENPQTRVQARLLAENNSISIGGRGPAMRDACHMLYQNTARLYAEHRRKKDD